MVDRLPLEIRPQPDDTACGPTCLEAVYRYWGDDLGLERVMAETGRLEDGGTLAVMLGLHALSRGYRARIYSYNLLIFDPSWFGLNAAALGEKLCEQLRHKDAPKLRVASEAYLEFLHRGGEMRFDPLTPALLRRYLNREIPILAGLSATYLYGCPREIFPGGRYAVADDVRGEPTGHFVVLCGYDKDSRAVTVADPHSPNPVSADPVYHVDIDRLIGSIMLGILTYDANLLVLQPARRARMARGGNGGDESSPTAAAGPDGRDTRTH